MSKRLTLWFKDGELPARRGVYQQQNPLGELGYQRWDGRYWYGWSSTADAAAAYQVRAAAQFQRDPWRGLAENPIPSQGTEP